VIVFLLVLFRIRLWVPNAGVRTSGELVKRDLSQALAKTKPADESISQPSISSLLDPYFSSDTLPPASLASVVERFHSDAVAARDGPETAIWVNVLVAHALKFLRDFGDELDSLSGGDSKEQGTQPNTADSHELSNLDILLLFFLPLSFPQAAVSLLRSSTRPSPPPPVPPSWVPYA
jgi:hypothetical protein